MVIIKFFLNISKKEQKKRFLERIDDPKRTRKFAASDLKGKRLLEQIIKKPTEDVLSKTSDGQRAMVASFPPDDKCVLRVSPLHK